MGVATFEGFVEDGQIRLKADVRLPDGARVYVLVPDMKVAPVARIVSPRLAHHEQAQDFKMMESIHVYVDNRDDLRADHILRLWGIWFLKLHYAMSRVSRPQPERHDAEAGSPANTALSRTSGSVA